MIKSGFIALSVRAVSNNVSPFFIALSFILTFVTKAPRRLPAISKLVCVLVEVSKKILIIFLPVRCSPKLLAIPLEFVKLSARLNILFDGLLRATQFKDDQKRILIPYKNNSNTLPELRKNGWVTIVSHNNKLKDIEEAKIYKCSYILKGDEIKKI